MTKRAWGPTWRTTAGGKIELVRAPSEDWLWTLEMELDEWHNAHPDAMPPTLWQKLLELIAWQSRQNPRSRDQIQEGRWWAVRWALKRGLTPKQAHEDAVKFWRGSAEGVRRGRTSPPWNFAPPFSKQII